MARKSTIVRFQNRQGHTLTGRLDMQDEGEPLAFGVFSSCFTCTKDSLASSRICRALADRNLAMLRFDHAGLGESGGDFFNTTVSVRIDDILSACTFLEENYKSPSLIIGHSIGGTISYPVAMQVPSIELVATIGSPKDTSSLAHKFVRTGQAVFFEDHIELMVAGQRIRLERDFIDDMRKHDIMSAMNLYPGKAIVFHSPSDNIVSFDNAEEIYERLSSHKKLIRLHPAASHLLERPEDTAIIAEAVFHEISKN